MAAVCLYHTYSRVGAVLFALAAATGAAYLWMSRGKPERQRAQALVVLAAMASYSALALANWSHYVERFRSASRELQTDRTAAETLHVKEPRVEAGKRTYAMNRREMYAETWALWKRRPLAGWGLGAYARRGHAGHVHSHNVLLEAGLSGGLVGALLLLLPLVYALVKGHGFLARGFIGLALLSGLPDCYFVFLWPSLILAAFVGLALRHDG
jgi:O-antigen ligase